ncbi:uncharacterized protein BDCG_17992 [Blastomyces dermatitidis ER-3]|uniref:Uncharacterized protein n=1 Tax=Ajellomyces dermatitidis (strain ER-3 / ATCC MYA-2586) TaxID=559297 RepID=A0ABX2W1G9_AJEDR|nr:uncharacterized protein BDCG_17992 [Blastomyces dermatitidis ER-3]OAT03231.1 hypothetical protein BDCG_17992 [Blastomyces dermatitidis ER-3]
MQCSWLKDTPRLDYAPSHTLHFAFILTYLGVLKNGAPTSARIGRWGPDLGPTLVGEAVSHSDPILTMFTVT